MKHTAKKKKRSRARKLPGNDLSRDKQQQKQGGGEEDEQKLLISLMEAFDSVTLEEAASAYEEANGDPNKAAEILSNSVDNDNSSEGPYPSASSVWSGSTSGSSSGFMETGCVQNVARERGCRGNKQQKRVVAVTGTVSTVLGKDYVRASPRKEPPVRPIDKEEAEQFLCSMLGDECQLSMAVVRDILCQCGYNVEKALDALLVLSSSSEQSGNGRYSNNNESEKQDAGVLDECTNNLTDRASDCTSHSTEAEFQDGIWSVDYGCSPRSKVSDLPQKVLESLFNISKSPEHEPMSMNWKNVVKKMESLGPGFDVIPSSVTEPQQDSYAKGDEYQVFRKASNQHWASMKSYYQKAAAAHSKKKWNYAAYLSDQGRTQTKLAQQAEEKASQDIFQARNKDIENVITIDLHGQHVKQAMRLLKVHLLFVNYVQSIRTLRVITGCGGHGVGKSKVKQSVINLLEKECMEWSEENRGTVLVKLNGCREYSFQDTDSDSE